MRQIDIEAKAQRVEVIGGHTEVTDSVADGHLFDRGRQGTKGLIRDIRGCSTWRLDHRDEVCWT